MILDFTQNPSNHSRVVYAVLIENKDIELEFVETASKIVMVDDSKDAF